MDMDYILPDDVTTEKMRLAYEEMLRSKDTSVLSLSTENLSSTTENTKKSNDFSVNNQENLPACAPMPTSTNILVLYFIFALGYNLGYGTSIFDTNISMGRFQSQERPTGNFNYFFKGKQ
jgi:hypothetical protein